MGNDKKAAAGGSRDQTYPVTSGNIIKFYVLGSEDSEGRAGAFADVAAAIDAAQHFVFIADWSFQALTRVAPRPAAAKDANLLETVGHMLLRASARSESMLVGIHTWDHVNQAVPDPLNDDGDDVLDAMARAGNFKDLKRPSNLIWRMSSRTGVGNSHHQKFVVLDAEAPDGSGRRAVKAFFGGLDLTKGRFDFADSPILPPPTLPDGKEGPSTNPFRLKVKAGKFETDDWYNAEFKDNRGLPRQGWQDFYASVVGPSAWDVVREWVGRWNRLSGSLNPTGGPGDTQQRHRNKVRDKFTSLFDKAKFLQEDEPHGGPFKARVVRSMVKADWGPTLDTDPLFNKDIETKTKNKDGQEKVEFNWVVSGQSERSIALSYLNAINNAQRFIYIETQYLIGSGAQWRAPQPGVKNDVPGAIARRIVDRINQGKEFHAYLVLPMFPEGDPISGPAQRQRFFEFNTMRFMIETVFNAAAAKGKVWQEFLSFYFLANWNQVSNVKLSGTRQERVGSNRRYQLYVHSKLMIVDDEYAILGSANLNERSLAGDRDSEICLSMLADDGKLGDVRQVLGDLRRKAWQQHLGSTSAIPDLDAPEKPSCSGAIRSAGMVNWSDMSKGIRKPAPNNGHLLHLPFDATKSGDSVLVSVKGPNTDLILKQQDLSIFDAATRPVGKDGKDFVTPSEWDWTAPKGTSMAPLPDFIAE
jgi:phospholipase D1/2